MNKFFKKIVEKKQIFINIFSLIAVFVLGCAFIAGPALLIIFAHWAYLFLFVVTLPAFVFALSFVMKKTVLKDVNGGNAQANKPAPKPIQENKPNDQFVNKPKNQNDKKPNNNKSEKNPIIESKPITKDELNVILEEKPVAPVEEVKNEITDDEVLEVSSVDEDVVISNEEQSNLLDNNYALEPKEFWDRFLENAEKRFRVIAKYKRFDCHLDNNGFMLGIEPRNKFDRLFIMNIDFNNKVESYIKSGTAFADGGKNIISKTKMYKDYKRRTNFIKFIDEWFDEILKAIKK